MASGGVPAGVPRQGGVPTARGSCWGSLTCPCFSLLQGFPRAGVCASMSWRPMAGGDVHGFVCAPTGEMRPRQSPRQAGLCRPCVLAHGRILGIHVQLCDSALGRGTLHTGLSSAPERIHRERVSLCPYTCMCSQCLCVRAWGQGGLSPCPWPSGSRGCHPGTQACLWEGDIPVWVGRMPPGTFALPGAHQSVFILVYRHLSCWLTLLCDLSSQAVFAALGRGASSQSCRSRESAGAHREAKGKAQRHWKPVLISVLQRASGSRIGVELKSSST